MKPQSQAERKRALNRERMRRYRARKDLVRVEVYVRGRENAERVREFAAGLK